MGCSQSQQSKEIVKTEPKDKTKYVEHVSVVYYDVKLTGLLVSQPEYIVYVWTLAFNRYCMCLSVDVHARMCVCVCQGRIYRYRGPWGEGACNETVPHLPHHSGNRH